MKLPDAPPTSAHSRPRRPLVEQTGRTPKTHGGVHKEFLRLTRDDPHIAADLRIFLSQSYNLKFIADYEIGPRAKVTAELASATLDTARLFVARIVALLA
jgi:uncharacterized protein (UPF0332 family)